MNASASRWRLRVAEAPLRRLPTVQPACKSEAGQLQHLVGRRVLRHVGGVKGKNAHDQLPTLSLVQPGEARRRAAQGYLWVQHHCTIDRRYAQVKRLCHALI
jgi:hypothetical protein